MRRLFIKQVHRIHVECDRKPVADRGGQRRVGHGYQPVGAALEGELHMGAEHLDQVDFEVRGRSVASRRSLLPHPAQMLRPNAEYRFPARQPLISRLQVTGYGQAKAPGRHHQAPILFLDPHREKFMGGVPMKPATKGLAGWL